MKYKNYINNEWVDGRDGSIFDVENPFTEEIKIDHKITSDDARGHQH